MSLYKGFSSCYWKNEPGKWENSDGSWKLSEDQQVLELHPDTKRDYWRRTYYTPLLIKDDGPRYVVSLPTLEPNFTVTTTMHLHPQNQFDQGGLFVRFDHEHWIKAGIEYVGTKLPRGF